MRKLFLIVLGLTLFLNAYCQEDTLSRKGKFALNTSFKLGFSQLNSLTYKNLNGSVQIGEILASYGFLKNAIISTGIAVMDFNANIFDSGGVRNLKNQYLQFPLKVSTGYSLGNKRTSTTQAIFGVGLLGTYHLKSTLEGSNAVTTANTWSIGMVVDLGLEFSILKDLNMGVGIESQFGRPTLGDNHKMNLTNNMLKFSFIYKP